MFVKKTGEIIELKQRLTELNSSDAQKIHEEVAQLHHKKKMQIIMIVGEGTVFLLLLLFGIYKIRQSWAREMEFNARQKNFFLSITHELKTPIAATKLQLQTLRKHQLDENKKNELIGNALNETERLNALIDNLLLANRLDSNEFILKKEKENISELTEHIIERYYKSAVAKNELHSEIEKNIYLNADKTAFPSIITNLIDNALKYSLQEKSVVVTLKKSGNNVILSVADQGIGIKEADRKKIFEKFYRAGDEETRKTKGTGLGLYIVKDLVSKHSGKISVKSNQPTGSIFEITFHAV
jgi:signal transduction histidine kinase